MMYQQHHTQSVSLVQFSIITAVITLDLLTAAYLQGYLIMLSYKWVLSRSDTLVKQKLFSTSVTLRHKSTTCGLRRLNSRLVFSCRTPVTIKSTAKQAVRQDLEKERGEIRTFFFSEQPIKACQALTWPTTGKKQRLYPATGDLRYFEMLTWTWTQQTGGRRHRWVSKEGNILIIRVYN